MGMDGRTCDFHKGILCGNVEPDKGLCLEALSLLVADPVALWLALVAVKLGPRRCLLGLGRWLGFVRLAVLAVSAVEPGHEIDGLGALCTAADKATGGATVLFRVGDAHP